MYDGVMDEIRRTESGAIDMSELASTICKLSEDEMLTVIAFLSGSHPEEIANAINYASGFTAGAVKRLREEL